MALLEVGRIIRPHGLRGELVVDLVTNRLERLAPGSCLVLGRPGRDGGGRAGEAEGATALEVESSRPHQGRHLVVFAGVATREAAEALRGGVLYAEALEDADALFVHDLIGAEVFEVDGTPRGRVTAVEANPASDLLVLDDAAYVPLRFVVSSSPGRVEIDVPAGLFD